MSDAKFKVGDRVRTVVDPKFGTVTCDNGRPAVLSPGHVGTVLYDRDSDGDYKVSTEPGDEYGYFVHEDSLEFEVQPTAKLGARLDKIIHKVEVEKVVTVEEEQVEEVVTLTMTKAQAETLRAIARRVGGHPKDTRRGFVDEIDAMLMDAGVKSPAGVNFDGATGYQAIYFGVEEGLR